MKTYSYSDSVTYYTNKAKDSVSIKQAWFCYGKVKNLTRWYELTDDQVNSHKVYLTKLGKAIELKYEGTKVETKVVKPVSKKAEPSVKLAEPISVDVSKNGRTNNALRVKAVIENLEASIEILRAIK
mgnify:CR=1 FL=1|tara:strand:- start:2239 stop:2619 length:381 start_codon:yes stop_codon:yes gene_type:complete